MVIDGHQDAVQNGVGILAEHSCRNGLPPGRDYAGSLRLQPLQNAAHDRDEHADILHPLGVRFAAGFCIRLVAGARGDIDRQDEGPAHADVLGPEQVGDAGPREARLRLRGEVARCDVDHTGQGRGVHRAAAGGQRPIQHTPREDEPGLVPIDVVL
ncbi:MAG: hypothetical protein JWN66_4400 [Sphingomonas bacterium]|nr:hypothetical protein [Sphingomonas bacterium]